MRAEEWTRAATNAAGRFSSNRNQDTMEADEENQRNVLLPKIKSNAGKRSRRARTSWLAT